MMKHNGIPGFLFWLLLYAFCPLFHLCGDAKGTVTASKLNVRVRPELGSSTVALLEKNSSVDILARSGEWYQIKAPSDTGVWAAASFVENGILMENANLRAGPSVAFEKFPSLKPGTQISVIDNYMQHWLRIKTPEGLSAWVNARYVSVAPGDIPEIPVHGGNIEAGALYPEKASSAGDGREKAVKAQDFPFIEGDAMSVALEGVLLPLTPDSVLVTHALSLKVNDEYFPIAYVYAGKDNLKLWEKRNVRINGLQRWVKGWKRPVIEIERITPSGQ